MLPVNGLYGHIQRNNAKSLLLLGVFFLLFEILAFILWLPSSARDESVQRPFSQAERSLDSPPSQMRPPAFPALLIVKRNFERVMSNGDWIIPLTGAFCWLVVAWSFLNYAVTKATKASPVDRRAEPRLYNIVENLSILAGLPRPAVYVMETDALNAFAAGLTPATAMIAVSRGLLRRLNDDELEAVLAHEIMHIKNRDTRLVAVASLFSGILFRFAWLIGSHNLKPNPMMALTLPFLTFFFWETLGVVIWTCFAVVVAGWLTRFAISRARDYIADAGVTELTKNPDALASALCKIEGRETLAGVDVAVEAMLFASGASGPLSTHPSPRARIAALRDAAPEIASEKSMRGLSDRDERITWESIKAAASRTPKWVSHPYVLIPAVVMNFGVTYAVAAIFNPTLANDISGMFALPKDPPKPERRVTAAACFPLDGTRPYSPGTAPLRTMPTNDESMRNSSRGDELFFAWRGKNALEWASTACPAGACKDRPAKNYREALHDYFRARAKAVREYDRDYGAPGMAFAQSYFDNARDRALLDDLKKRIALKEIDPADMPGIYDALHLALEKPPGDFIPCHNDEEWRRTAFPAAPASAQGAQQPSMAAQAANDDSAAPPARRRAFSLTLK